jgi:signal peptidase I
MEGENSSKNSPPVGGEEMDKYYGVGSFVMEIIKIVVLAFVIIVPIRIFLFQPFFVQGASMEPNFEDGEYLIVNELGYKQTDLGLGNNSFYTIKPFKEVNRQVVVVFRYPLDPSKFFIKRVIGLPGEKVEVKNGQVTIYNKQNPNGFILDEKNYLSPSVHTNGDQTVTLAGDEYFVMGDNRMFSSDSRAWGPVKEKNIIGMVLLRAWPLNRISGF